ncbi:MAG: acetylglutamate kinase [Candidatus Thermoplasmatota archaeon]|nr:acetylglutamate kinase [Candidatus Thermoplasmatota archaeon]
MYNTQQKIQMLVEVLPYIKKYSGKIVVIKYGGNAMTDEEGKKSVIADVALLRQVGICPVFVHGGGPEINREMQKANIKPVFVNGLRYTDKKTMGIVRKVSANINGEMVKMFKDGGCKAENATDGLMKTAIKNSSLGLVGEIVEVDSGRILQLIEKGIIPVISPVGHDGTNYTNINADTVASKVAEAVNAEKLTILTNVEGVYENGKLIPHLSVSGAKEGIKKGFISGGMIPKVLACVNAVNKGVKKAHLVDGTVKHSLLLEIFTDKGIGTEVVKDEKRKSKAA